ncbi:hypothetical protein ACFSSC_10565 [Corynebacterium mendelii]|uniref:4'-phosphopantetheinyl transferase n=1 Tax=Corynebacterium mendelii TaxID=2765362 RepID=A0A939E2P8_9CORY|nr:hypothetical protein [Corynebacterium mendelii]MBN9644342.1 hypothetical protein [Corynebacterium mendelii]
MVAQVLVDALAPDSTRLCPECASRSHGAVVARSRFVSVSHARSLVVVAVSDWPVGIDVDHAGDIRGTTGATNPHLWTRREAVVKLRGIRDATATLACAGVSVCPWPQHAVATAGQVATTDLVIPAGRGTGRYAASVAWPTSGTTPAHSSMTVVHRDGDRLIARLLGKQQTAP